MTADEANAMTDLVTYRGKRYRLTHLAFHMEFDHREEIHSELETDTPVTFWDRFCERFPQEAHYASLMTPTISIDF